MTRHLLTIVIFCFASIFYCDACLAFPPSGDVINRYVYEFQLSKAPATTLRTYWGSETTTVNKKPERFYEARLQSSCLEELQFSQESDTIFLMESMNQVSGTFLGYYWNSINSVTVVGRCQEEYSYKIDCSECASIKYLHPNLVEYIEEWDTTTLKTPPHKIKSLGSNLLWYLTRIVIKTDSIESCDFLILESPLRAWDFGKE